MSEWMIISGNVGKPLKSNILYGCGHCGVRYRRGCLAIHLPHPGGPLSLRDAALARRFCAYAQNACGANRKEPRLVRTTAATVVHRGQARAPYLLTS